jgi:RNA polymerase sigma factor (sigma-70 family)
MISTLALVTRILRTSTGSEPLTMLDVYGLEPLLQRVMAKDGRAFEELLARLRRYMHAEVRRRLGAGPHGPIDQSAIVQSVCRRVVVHFRELEGPTVPLLLGWVGAIVKNRVNDELRRIARHPVHSLGSDVLVLADPRPTAAADDRAARAAEVVAALARLPERQRRVVESRWFDRQADEVTAGELGITVNHVHQLRFRALERLRALLPDLAEAST